MNAPPKKSALSRLPCGCFQSLLLLLMHPPPLLLLCAGSLTSRSASTSPFVSCPLNPPSPLFPPLSPNLPLYLFLIYLLFSAVQNHLGHRVENLKQRKVAKILFFFASMSFLNNTSPLHALASSLSLSLCSSSLSVTHTLYLSWLCCLTHLKQGVRRVLWAIIYLFSQSKRH